jgi:carbamoyltransferase
MKIVSIFAGHDANITFADTEKNKYHVIEIERLVKKRYFRLHVDNSPEQIFNILSECQRIAKQSFGMGDEYDILTIVADGGLIPLEILSQIFHYKKLEYYDHHLSHAASTFYQSPFEESLIISYDGGGNDGFFNVYHANEGGIHPIESIKSDFGGGYLLLASCCTEITKSSRHELSLAGKLMGLCAYGKVDQNQVDVMKHLFIDKNYKKLSESLGNKLKNVECPWRNPLENYIFEGQDSYDFAANAQSAYETMFLEIFDRIIDEYPIKNVCLTGGGALNVLLNQRIKNTYDVNLFVSPNPNDCGLSLGASFLTNKPKETVNISYSGIPILDEEKLDVLLEGRKTSKLDLDHVSKLLKSGKIIGVCRNDSEVGPRALGNRSIICDPSFKDMKDILNAKVKFREWFRPFAPFCLKEEAHFYFDSKDFDNMEFMSYAPLVKEQIRKNLPSITHVDGSSRLQTVTEESHKFFYDLLKTYSNYSDINVLLNTSFNIRGNPILTTIEDALYVLDNTELDCVIINDFLVEK